jgi:hypothetical protein
MIILRSNFMQSVTSIYPELDRKFSASLLLFMACLPGVVFPSITILLFVALTGGPRQVQVDQ